ncbi:DUF4880 domain-containing protein, partial [Acinetobacter baumannii]|nr:DUF4880 domain-containing protein [Acinetobacter baumannii]
SRPDPDSDGAEGLFATAAEWQVRRQDGLDSDEEALFQAWLAADARHQAAYARIDDVWRGPGELPATAIAHLSAPPRRAPAPVRPPKRD